MTVSKKTTLTICLCGVAVILVGVIDIMTNYEDNKCDMTWMFQWPQYDPIPLSAAIKKMYPSYDLFIYSEGYFSNYDSDTKLTGVPVLFIPGNAGSHKQVRSLASVALRRAEHVRSSFHFDFFSIDFNEELSAWYGGVLQRQTDFVAVCIRRILSLYKHLPRRPTSVVLIGHSMGGVLARALFTLTDFNRSTVPVIITQSTPHQAPVISLDQHIASFYKNIDAHWLRAPPGRDPPHVTLVSTGGGFRDILVRQALTRLTQTTDRHPAISTCTMTVPRAWVSTDHLCAVWCRQMVLVTVRALFDVVDQSSQQIHTDSTHRQRVFSHHFLSHTGYSLTSHIRNYIPPHTITPELAGSHVHKVMSKHDKDLLLYLPLDNTSLRVVAVTNAEHSEWIGACQRRQQPLCRSIDNLSLHSRLIPSSSGHKKVVHLDVAALQPADTLVFYLPRANKPVYLTADLYDPRERHLTHPLPSFIQALLTYPESIMNHQHIVTVQSNTNAVFTNISLIGLVSVLQAYTVLLETSNCTDTIDTNEATTLILWLPWTHEHVNLTVNKTVARAGLDVKLQTPHPGAGRVSHAQLHLYTQPGCQYSVSIGVDLKQLAGQFVRFYGVMLPAFIVAVILASHYFDSDKMDVLSVAWNLKSTMVVLVSAAVTGTILSWSPLHAFVTGRGLPVDDIIHLRDARLWFTLFFPVLYLTSLAIFTLHLTILHTALTFIGGLISFIFNRCAVPTTLGRCLRVFRVAAVVLCVGVSAMVCGALGVACCSVIKLIRVVVTYSQRERLERRTLSHLLDLLVWMWLCLLNAAQIVFWAKNLKYTWILPADPMSLTGPVLCTAFLVNLSTNSGPARQTRTMSAAHLIATVLVCVYAPVSLYRATYIVTCLLLYRAIVNLALSMPTIGYRKSKQL